jgi:hypothetical protein
VEQGGTVETFETGQPGATGVEVIGDLDSHGKSSPLGAAAALLKDLITGSIP